MASGFDVVVVGAGIVGLASAAALARAGRSVLIVERHDGIARETTSRNSQVVHSGLYYPTDSWKARTCTEGRERLYRRCADWGVPVRKLGKLVVAVDDDECAEIERLAALGTANGVPGLRVLDAGEVARREPQVRARAALWSPETGIVDAHAFATSYLAEAERGDAVLALGREVVGVERRGDGYALRVAAEDGTHEDVACAAVVNAAGLEADRLAERAGLDVDALSLRQHPCKGDYFHLAPGSGVSLSHLVYPVPRGAGLGIHATLDLGGRIRFGPDAEYVDAPRYDVDPAKAETFAQAIARYLPGMQASWLAPDQAGVRPKLAGPGVAFRDFEIAERSEYGLPGWVDCIGIESPGLTASEAIADRVASLLASA